PHLQLLVQTQGIPTILVIALHAAKLPVSALVIAGNGPVVGRMDFQPNLGTPVPARNALRFRQKFGSDPAPRHRRNDSDRIEPAYGRFWTKEHRGGAGEFASDLGDDHACSRGAKKVPQAAA